MHIFSVEYGCVQLFFSSSSSAVVKIIGIGLGFTGWLSVQSGRLCRNKNGYKWTPNACT